MADNRRLIDEVADGIASAERMAADAVVVKLHAENASLRGRYKQALAAMEHEKARADAVEALKGIEPRKLKPSAKAKAGNATMVMLLSDIHCEERVKPESVNGVNSYDLATCDKRLGELSERFHMLLEHKRALAKIDRVVIWLGGDLISGHIHADTAELAQLAPLAACRWIGERMRGFIDSVAANAQEVIVATNSGNHGRSTEKLRVGTEMDHSFENNLYLSLKREEKNSNVQWQVGEGYLNYVDVEGFTIRFNHGHAVKYQGGVGGIHVPLMKAIMAWDATKRADVTVIGHWHQHSHGRNYVTNGSVIGYSPFAVKIKAVAEPPSQTAFIIDHGRNRVTEAFEVFCDRDLRK